MPTEFEPVGECTVCFSGQTAVSDDVKLIGSVAMSGIPSPVTFARFARALAGIVAAGLIALAGVVATSERAAALSKEQAIANCRETVGHPFVHACMQALGKGGDREANRAKCRASASPKVKACMLAALNAANGRANVAIEMYKDGKPKADAVAPGNALPAGFVAPPRTIADITAVLDDEKPDPALLARSKEAPTTSRKKAPTLRISITTAAAPAPARPQSGGAGGWREGARRGQAPGDGYFGQRIRQFISFQKLALGDIKGALQVAQFMVTDANRPGQRGYIFGAASTAASVLVQMGDIPQAEGYMRRSVALITEARTQRPARLAHQIQFSGRSWEGSVESIRATVFEARGQFREAEAAYAKAREWKLAAIPDLTFLHAPSPAQLRGFADGRSPQHRAHEGQAGPARGSRGRRAQRTAGAAQGAAANTTRKRPSSSSDLPTSWSRKAATRKPRS